MPHCFINHHLLSYWQSTCSSHCSPIPLVIPPNLQTVISVHIFILQPSIILIIRFIRTITLMPILLLILLLITMTMMVTRWTSRENLLAAAGDEDGDPQLFVSLYDFQVFITNLKDIDDGLMMKMKPWWLQQYHDNDDCENNESDHQNAGGWGKPTQPEKGRAGKISMMTMMMIMMMYSMTIVWWC